MDDRPVWRRLLPYLIVAAIVVIVVLAYAYAHSLEQDGRGAGPDGVVVGVR